MPRLTMHIGVMGGVSMELNRRAETGNRREQEKKNEKEEVEGRK